MAGEDLLVDAPSYLSDIPEVDWESIWVTPSRVLLTGIANPTGTYKLVAKMSASQGTGVTSGWNKTVVITPGMEDDWGDAGLTELYTEKIGYMPSIGEKVFIELYWLDPATGLVGETMRTTAICMSEAQAKGGRVHASCSVLQWYVRRSKGAPRISRRRDAGRYFPDGSRRHHRHQGRRIPSTPKARQRT